MEKHIIFFTCRCWDICNKKTSVHSLQNCPVQNLHWPRRQISQGIHVWGYTCTTPPQSTHVINFLLAFNSVISRKRSYCSIWDSTAHARHAARRKIGSTNLYWCITCSECLNNIFILSPEGDLHICRDDDLYFTVQVALHEKRSFRGCKSNNCVTNCRNLRFCTCIHNILTF